MGHADGSAEATRTVWLGDFAALPYSLAGKFLIEKEESLPSCSAAGQNVRFSP